MRQRSSLLLLVASLLALTGCVQQPPVTQCVPPPPGMISWWPGDGDAQDIQGPHNGFLNPPAAANAPGMVGQAFDLRQEGDLVTIDPQDSSFDFSITTSFTIDAWILAKRKRVNHVGIVSKSRVPPAEVPDASPNGRYALQMTYVRREGEIDWESGRADFFTSEGTGAAVNDNLWGTSTIDDGAWHHIAAVYDAETFTKYLYVDGRCEGKQDLSEVNRRPDEPLDKNNFLSRGRLVLGQNDMGPKNFDGLLDEVEIFGRALTGPRQKGKDCQDAPETEICQIYLAGRLGKCKPEPDER